LDAHGLIDAGLSPVQFVGVVFTEETNGLAWLNVEPEPAVAGGTCRKKLLGQLRLAHATITVEHCHL